MKKSKLARVIVLIFIILLVIIGVGYAYIKTDLFKTPNQLFGKYLIDSVIQVSKFNLEPYSEIFERIKNEKTEIVGKQEIEYRRSDMIYSISENEKISSEEIIKLDIPNKNMEILMDIKNNGKDFFKINVLKTDNTYGVFIPEVHEKYLAIENNDLKKIAKTLGLPNEVIEQMPNQSLKISFSEEEIVKFKKVALKYGIKISDSIDTSLYAKEKYNMRNIDRKKIKGNKYVLTISEDKFRKILEDTFLELENDKEFLDIIEGNVFKIYFDYIKAVRDYINSFSDIVSNEENNVIEEKVIKLSVYEYKGNTVKFEILYETGDIIEFFINNKDISSNIRLRTYKVKTDFNKVGLETIFDFSNKYENNNSELILSVQTKYNEEDIEALKRKTIKEKSYFASFYTNEYYAARYPNSNAALKIITNFDGDVVNTKIENNKSNKSNLNQKFDLVLKFNPKLKLQLLNDENKIVLNDYTTEEFMKLKKELMNNLKQYAEKNPETLIGSNMQKKIEEEKKNIELYKEHIKEKIELSIKVNLYEYRNALTNGENANIADYLTLEKIKESIIGTIDEIEFVDDTTLKCLLNNYTYFVKINIDTNEGNLNDITVLYSEDGTLESAS